jgi:hypothetical protein
MRAIYPRLFLMLLIILAVMVRGFVPAGFMPSSTSSDITALTICSGFGERVVYLDSNGVEHAAPSHEKSHGGCSFALASHTTPPATNFDVIPVFYVTNFVARDDVTQKVTLYTPSKNFDAQGPPFILA